MRTHYGVAALVAALLAGCQCNRPPPKDPVLMEGSPCLVDDQCETGFCESVLGKPKVCIRKCTTGCKALEVCTTLVDNNTDGPRRGCVPELAGLCKACAADSDCPYPGDKCIVLGGAKFCGRDCGFDDTSCPSSFRCADAVGLTGEMVKSQCQPESGTCACIATTAGQTVPCEAQNANGRCIGVKVCEPPKGYGQCSAKTPAAEICNGEDDDCDNMIDEGLGDVTCGVGECLKKTAACANGLPQTCTPGSPIAERCDQKDNDCDGTVDNGFDTQTDVGNCGSCGFACVVTNAVPKCELGKCGVLHCLPGWTDRDGVAANGCEFQCTPVDGGNGGAEVCDGLDNDCNGIIDDGFNLVSDPTNCGQCGLVCNVPGGSVATYQCVARVCGIATCVPGKGNCNQVYVDGCETNTASDLAHCGACGAACAPPHATGSCTNGTCNLGACSPGWANCNLQTPDGCEVNTATDPNNCGLCGTVCSFPNATSTCTAGACGLTCLANWWNADNVLSNGCEYACVPTNNGVEKCDGIDNDCDAQIDEGFSTMNDPSNCGACGAVCQSPFVQTFSCTAGSCGIIACQSGRGDCNGQYVDGCETQTSSSLAHCGACNAACVTPNATPVCNSGTCAIGSCNAGFRDCNGLRNDGCEIDSQTNVNHCGACNNQCVLAFATPACVGGTCQVGACQPGHWNNDGLAVNGCEYACVPSGFETCDGVDNDCNGVVDDGFNLATDPTHCGSCSNNCTATQASTYKCTLGNCGVLTCNGGYADCDAIFANGCEVNTNTSLSSCGACGAACTTPNATPVCNTGTCAISSCNPGFRNCNGTVSDGCEINSNTDPANCGGCGTQCSFPGANAFCSGGSCGYTCQTNRWDLDGNAANGCEYSCVYQSATDIPDVAFVDANCDGIDGEVNNAIYVSPTGNDLNSGLTRTSPKATINAALAAASANNKRDVYVAAGTYTQQVALLAGKGVFGAYTSGTFARSNANVVTITGSSPALVANAANNSTLQLVGVIGSNATGTSNTAYGALFVNSANVSLQAVSLRAGAGSNGAAGSSGGSGSNGTNGFQGQNGCEDSGGIFCTNCARPQGGNGGTSACGRTGGKGGAAGHGGSYGDTGATGVGGTPGGPGTPPGQFGWSTPMYYWGQTGADGATGAAGTSGANFGTLGAGGYIVAYTSSGGLGGDGNGGGGGGGGGGGDDDCNSFGGGGGGGGGGGCGGGAGTAGTSGGAAIALYLWNSSVSATGSTFQTGNGGVGGNGGAGGSGGSPGAGGPISNYGGSGEQDDGSNGGGGGYGGWGGNGGWGGAGGGGPAIGVLRAGGSAFVESSSTYLVGNGGAGGFSGAGNGATGYKTNVY